MRQQNQSYSYEQEFMIVSQKLTSLNACKNSMGIGRASSLVLELHLERSLLIRQHIGIEVNIVALKLLLQGPSFAHSSHGIIREIVAGFVESQDRVKSFVRDTDLLNRFLSFIKLPLAGHCDCFAESEIARI